MKPKYLNNLIEDSYNLFTRMKGGIIKAGLVALVGAIIGVGVYGCKKEPEVWEERLYKQTKIAFASNRYDLEHHIYVMNADGSEQERLTLKNCNYAGRDWYAGDPSWSPDGKKIVFMECGLPYTASGNVRSFNENYRNFYRNSAHKVYAHKLTGEICVMNPDGTGLKILTDNFCWDRYPSWSPDGKKIAFVSDRYAPGIYIMNADGSQQERLTNTSGVDVDPSWSPDGRKIAFESKRDGHWDIYVMNADGSQQERLTNTSLWGSKYPSWSPDGKKIAFESYNRHGSWGIYVMNADGSKQNRLTAHVDDEPSWSPFLPSENKTNEKK